MGLFAAGQVVVVPFPYTDLSGQKLRPALLLAPDEHSDWIICQITTNPYSDPFAVELTPASFSSGGIHHVSYARPTKLFTANESLVQKVAGTLTNDQLGRVRDAVVQVLKQ